MLTYATLQRFPQIFPHLFGLTAEAFDSLVADYLAAKDRRLRRSRTTRAGTPRQRQPGGGAKPQLDARTRLLLALFWLRVYPTYEVLGFFFSLHKTNARHNCQAVLAVLESLDDFPCDRPQRERPKLGTPMAVMDAYPQIRLVIDSKEQRIRRPQGYRRQKPYYSGKKKTHTLKTQIGVDPAGRIDSVSCSYPGAVHDLTLLRRTRLLDCLPATHGAMLDKGYDGVAKDYPDLPLRLPFKARRNHPLTEEQKAANRVLARYRIVVEHVNAQLNRFEALRQVYRGARARHTRVVRVAAVLVNRQTRRKPLKTYVAAA